MFGYFRVWTSVNDIANESVYVYADGSPVTWTNWGWLLSN